MAQMINDLTVLVNAVDTVLTTNTLIVPSVVVDTREALSGVVHVKFKTTTGGASNTIKVYGIYSPDGANFDDASTTLIKELGTIVCPNDTAYHITTIPLTADAVTANYMKLGFYCNAASNVGYVNDARVTMRRPN